MDVKQKINVLAQLAYSDKEIAERERRLIHQIGVANGMTKDEVDEILHDPQPMGDPGTMSDDQKFEYLYNIVQLMKIDGEVYKSEIVFCQEMAERLGYKKKVISTLSAYIYSDPSITTDRDRLKAKVQKFMVG